MIGIVLTGHGNFADGLYSGVKLIGGKQENFELVNFEEGLSTDDLAKRLNDAFDKLPEQIIVFADLAGGSPFKQAVTEALNRKDKKINVIGGTNMGMLLECALMRNFLENYDELVEKALASGKDAVVKFELVKRQEEVSDDGI